MTYLVAMMVVQTVSYSVSQTSSSSSLVTKLGTAEQTFLVRGEH